MYFVFVCSLRELKRCRIVPRGQNTKFNHCAMPSTIFFELLSKSRNLQIMTYLEENTLYLILIDFFFLLKCRLILMASFNTFCCFCNLNDLCKFFALSVLEWFHMDIIRGWISVQCPQAYYWAIAKSTKLANHVLFFRK